MPGAAGFIGSAPAMGVLGRGERVAGSDRPKDYSCVDAWHRHSYQIGADAAALVAARAAR